MFNFRLSFLCVFVGISFCSPVYSQWQNLFNSKNLEDWDTYIGPAFDSARNSFDTLKVLGLNKDPNRLFSVVKEDGQPALRISGENFGGISTKSEFKNYHLKLEFKWGRKKSNPRKEKKRDSGILYHAVGKHGADFGFWMRSQEFQIQEGDCGDYWGVAGGSFEIPARKNTDGFVYDPAMERLVFNEKSKSGRWCIKLGNPEKPTGEWNIVEIYCLNDTAVHIVNGAVVMILYRSGQLEKSKVVPLSKGKIQIQSEGAEIFYRNIQIEGINKIPEEIVRR